MRYASVAAVKDVFQHFKNNELHYDRIVRVQLAHIDIGLECSHKFENRYGQVKRFKEIWESTRSQQSNTISDRIEKHAPVNDKIRRDLKEGVQGKLGTTKIFNSRAVSAANNTRG